MPTTSSPRATVRQRIDAVRAAALAEHAARREQARHAAASELVAAHARAEERIADATYQEIFSTHDNVIRSVRPDGTSRVLFTTTDLLPTPAERAAAAAQHDALRRTSDSASDLRRRITAQQAELARLTERMERERPVAGFVDLGNQISAAFGGRHTTTVGELIAAARNELMRLTTALITVTAEAAALGAAPTGRRPANAAIADIALDPSRPVLYWARWASPFEVGRYDLVDGGEPRPLYTRPRPVTSVAVGTIAGRPQLLWIEGNGEIWAGDPDGDDASVRSLYDITAPGQGGLWQLAVDPVHGYVFWTNTLSIWRAELAEDLGPTAVMVVSPSESPYPIDLAVDGADDALYWIDRTLGRLRRSDLDGNRVEDIFEITRPMKGLEVDRHAGFVYWADTRDGGCFLRRGSTGQTALLFDGRSPGLDLRAGEDLAAATVELRFDPTDSPGRQCLLARVDDRGDATLSVERLDATITVRAGGQAMTLPLAGTGPQWVAVTVGTRRSSTIVEAVTDAGEAGRFDVASAGPTAPGRWIIGASVAGDVQPYAGALREVRLWDGARTVADIVSGRRRPLDVETATDQGLIGCWRATDRCGPLLRNLADREPPAVFRSGTNPDELVGPLLHLRGDSSALHLPTLTVRAETGFTFETWIRRSGTAGPTSAGVLRLTDTGRGTGIEITMRGAEGEIGLTVRTPLKTQTVRSGAIAPDRWTHLAVTVDTSAKARVWIDGQTRQRTGLSVPDGWTIDADEAVVGDGLRADLAELRLWGTSRSSRSMRLDRHGRLRGDEAGLIGLWPLDDGRGTMVRTVAGPVQPAELRVTDDGLRARWEALGGELSRFNAQIARMEEIVRRGQLAGAQLDDAERLTTTAQTAAVALTSSAAELDPHDPDRAGAIAAAGVQQARADQLAARHERLTLARDASSAAMELAELTTRRDLIERDRTDVAAALVAADPWQEAELPIARTEIGTRRIHEVIEVDGCDGLAIVFRADYAAGLRAQAAAELAAAAAQAEDVRLRARAAADERIAAARDDRTAAARAKADEVARAQAAARGDENRAKRKRADASARAADDAARARAEARRRTDDAARSAAATESTARDSKTRRVAAATGQKIEAERSLDGARAARSAY